MNLGCSLCKCPRDTSSSSLSCGGGSVIKTQGRWWWVYWRGVSERDSETGSCPAAVWGPVWLRVCPDRSEPLTRDRYLPSERTTLPCEPSVRFPDNGRTAWPISTHSGKWTASVISTGLCCTISIFMVPFTSKKKTHSLRFVTWQSLSHLTLFITFSNKTKYPKTCKQKDISSILFLPTMKIQYHYIIITHIL